MVSSWFAVKTLATFEQLAATNITALGFEVFYPQILIQRLRKGQPKRITVPFYPGYLFSKFCPTEDYWQPIRRCEGVSYILCGAGEQPSAIPEPFMKELIGAARGDGIVLEETAEKLMNKYSVGDVLVFREGNFKGLQGVVGGVRKNRIEVLFSLLSRQTKASFDLQFLDKVVSKVPISETRTVN